jgi:imidazolonepropionase-like amidohydrolase
VTSPSNAGGGATTLRGVTIVDTRDGSLTANQDVTTAAGRIVEITASELRRTPDRNVVELSGKYLVPGYLDMHAHPLGDGDRTGTLRLMLTRGITGFRQMSGSMKLLDQRRAGTLPMPTESPAVVAMPGAVLTPLNAGSAKAAVKTVREQHAAGADFIKVGMVSPAVFFAAQAEAKSLNIPILGHLPVGIDVLEASARGMRSIEHLGPGIGILTACSPHKAELLATLNAKPLPELPFRIPFADKLFLPLLSKLILNPVARTRPQDAAVMQRTIDTFSEELSREVAARFVADGTWQVPTLIRQCSSKRCDAPEFRDDPNHRFVDPATLEQWHASRHRFDALPTDVRHTLRATYELELRLTKVFDEEGVKMLAGSDCSGAAWEVPGYALHQEFDALAQAGLSPLRVLQMTTLHAAEFLESGGTMGTVDLGKTADLVVLEDNPIQGVHNLHGIHGVMRAGEYYSRADLDAIERSVAEARSIN